MAAILDELGLDVDVPELRAYTDLLKEQATELEAEMQSLRLHPRYAALIVEGPFGFPMVIDGPREVERLDGVIEQIEAGLQRLSSTEALQEVRGAIREYPGLRRAPHARATSETPIEARRQRRAAFPGVLNAKFAGDEGAPGRFLREARMAAGLDPERVSIDCGPRGPPARSLCCEPREDRTQRS